jgi:hypothetical protein
LDKVGEFRSFSKTGGISVGSSAALADEPIKTNAMATATVLFNLIIEDFIAQRQ